MPEDIEPHPTLPAEQGGKKMDLVRLNAIKAYVKTVKKMRISDTAADDLRVRVNDMLKTILTEATAAAKAQRRSTVMPRDTEPVADRIFVGKNLNPTEIFREIKRLGPIELGQVVKLISDYIEQEKAKKE